MGFRKECVCEETSWFAKKQEWLSLTVLMTKKKKLVMLLRLTFLFCYSPWVVNGMGFGVRYIQVHALPSCLPNCYLGQVTGSL